MTATAQGSTMRCDRAGCSAVATVEKDAWAFCADHAGTPAQVTRGHLSNAPVAPTAASASATQPSAPIPHVVGGGTIGLLLEQASGHSSKRVQALAHRIETQLEQLRTMIAARAEDERRKRLEAETKEKARQDIVRLEQQLAAAKAKLRKPAAPKAARSTVDQQLPCRKGCHRTYASPQGRGKHERSCTAAS